MKALEMSAALLLVLFVVLGTFCGPSLAQSDDVCFFFKNNTKIRDPDSCSQYITCIDHVSHHSSCSGSTPFYDKETEKCVKTLDVADTFCSVSCTNSSGRFIEDPKSCRSYYYCYDEQRAAPGKCPESLHFNVTRQACVHKTESGCRASQFDYCAIAKSGTKIRDASACHKYYSCTKGQLKENTCSKKYYDPLKGDCVDKATVECVEHPLPANVCGKDGKPKNNAFVADGATCRGYFFCAKQEDGSPDAHPYWGQCPHDTFFSDSKGACVDPMQVKCDWDRCDGRTPQFVTATTKGCRNYLRCVKGIAAETLSCGNLFFDEKKGVCTTDIVKEPACSS